MLQHRISPEGFQRMVGAGVFPENLRLELLEGEPVGMSPIGPRRAAKVYRLALALRPLEPHQAFIWVQSPLRVLNPILYPDLALLKPRLDFYENAIPEAKDTLLVVGVSDTTLGYDFETKLPLYLQAGVREVWVLDLNERRALVYRGKASLALGPREALEVLGVRIPVEEVV